MWRDRRQQEQIYRQRTASVVVSARESSWFFFFTLRAEHGHAIGEFVAFGADVRGDVGEVQFFFNASVDRVTVLDNLQGMGNGEWGMGDLPVNLKFLPVRSYPRDRCIMYSAGYWSSVWCIM